MRFWNTAANIATGIALASSVLAAGVVVRREFSPRPAAASNNSEAPRDVKDWEQYIPTGRILGRTDASLKIVEFADFQCPACKSLETLLLKFRKDYPEDFAVSYHYAPLPYHKRAYEAARAAECAADQGRFEQMHDVIFSHFSELDTLSFARLAAEANMPNAEGFARCVASRDSIQHVNSDRNLATDTIRITGTPTVLVNGKAYQFAPSIQELTKMVEHARSERLSRVGRSD
jgi:protein-disulfide isomerase